MENIINYYENINMNKHESHNKYELINVYQI